MRYSFKTLLTFALAIFTSTAFAISQQEMAAESPSPANLVSKPGFHTVLNVGLTYGGDTIGNITFTNGNNQKIKAGSFMQFGIGGLYQFEEKPVALMLSANYHFDSISAKNGSASFDRFPIEALAYYTGKEKFRFGGGLRIVNGAELSTDIGGSEKYTFDTARGLVAEIGYQLDPNGWLNFRFVSEKYQAKTKVLNGTSSSLAGSTPVSGSHMGVNFTYQF